jgi:hypothetical protein
MKTAKLLVCAESRKKLVHCDSDGAAAGSFDPALYQPAVLIETASQKTMDGPSVGAALSLFILELIHFAEHLDRNPDMIVGKPIDGMRVMQQDISIENVVFN